MALWISVSAATFAQSQNPPMAGFDEEGSDAEAIAIADEVMAALGGRKAWDDTRYITWNFFGSRQHLWDRATGDVRIEWTDRESGAEHVVLMNLTTKKGGAWEDGDAVTDPETLAKRLDDGEAAWINDSYWLVMPYKLMDPGVTLKTVGKGNMVDGRPATVDRKSTRLNSSHSQQSRMPSSA